MIFKSRKVHSIATAETKLVWPISFNYFVDIAIKQLLAVNFDELFVLPHANHIDITLIFATDYRTFIKLTHGENVALCHDSIDYFKSERVNQVQHFFLRANAEQIRDNKGVSHVLDIQCFDLSSVASLENIDFVLAVHDEDVILANLVQMASRLPQVRAIHHWSALLEQCVL